MAFGTTRWSSVQTSVHRGRCKRLFRARSAISPALTTTMTPYGTATRESADTGTLVSVAAAVADDTEQDHAPTG